MKYYVVYEVWGDYNIPILSDLHFAGVKHEKVYWNIARNNFNSTQIENPIDIDDRLDFDFKSALIHYLFNTKRVEKLLYEA